MKEMARDIFVQHEWSFDRWIGTPWAIEFVHGAGVLLIILDDRNSSSAAHFFTF